MPEIQIRPAVKKDMDSMAALDRDYVSDFVWQMEIREEETQEINIQFRQIRLPRSIKVDYPRSLSQLLKEWALCEGILAAEKEGELLGYVSLVQGMMPGTTWVPDLVVARKTRRQGVGSALVLAAQAWAHQHGDHRLVLEMQSKNYPAICMAQKLGFDFCGYNDRYYLNRDIALFFAKSVR